MAAQGIQEELVRKLAERIRIQRLRHQLRRVRPEDGRHQPTSNDEPDASSGRFAPVLAGHYLTCPALRVRALRAPALRVRAVAA
jgi:hypothetical protein